MSTIETKKRAKMILKFKSDLDQINMSTYEIEKVLSSETINEFELEKATNLLKNIMITSKEMIRELNQ
jgi:hypothetical protein